MNFDFVKVSTCIIELVLILSMNLIYCRCVHVFILAYLYTGIKLPRTGYFKFIYTLLQYISNEYMYSLNVV